MDRGDEVLLVLLWRLRHKISTRHEILIPPEWIFTNAELESIVRERPTSMEALRQIPGIDPKRREVSGPEFIRLVAGTPTSRPQSTTWAPGASDNRARASTTKPTTDRAAARETTPDPPARRPKRGASATGRGGTNLFDTYGQQDPRPGGGGRYDG